MVRRFLAGLRDRHDLVPWRRKVVRVGLTAVAAVLVFHGVAYGVRTSRAISRTEQLFAAMHARDFRAAVDTLSWSQIESTASGAWSAQPKAWGDRWRLVSLRTPMFGWPSPPDTEWELEGEDGVTRRVYVNYVVGGRLNDVTVNGSRPFH